MMTRYTLHDLTLEVRQENEFMENGLIALLHALSWERTAAVDRDVALRLYVHAHQAGWRLPPGSRTVFAEDGFCGQEVGEDFYVTNGESCLYLQLAHGQGEARLAPAFFAKPVYLQDAFWAFGLLKLLRPLGYFSLHAAGLVSPQGVGLLLVGGSGSGKSTLTLGLLRRGWRYLSDDALLLRQQAEGVVALALRKHFYIDDSAAAAYADLPLGDTVPDATGAPRRRVEINIAYPGQATSKCLPRILLFPRIVPQPLSTLAPLDHTAALQQLLAQSGPQLFDRRTMSQHLAVLTLLLQQAAPYALQAGMDLYQDPGTLVHLLNAAEGQGRWPA